MPPAAIIGGGLVLGAAAGAAGGALGKKSSSDQTSGINQNPVVQGGLEQSIYGSYAPTTSADQAKQIATLENQLGAARAAGKQDDVADLTEQIEQIRKNPLGMAQQTPGFLQNTFNQIQYDVNQGPGGSDIKNAYQNSQSLSDLLSQYSQSGGLPNQQDINTTNGIAQNLFAARQVGLNQSFQDQTVAANRLSAQLGRSVDDPILQAKLRTGFMRQQDSLNAEQQGVSQQLALQLPGQRLGYAQQQNNVLNSLSTQAFSNQNYLMGLGSQLGSQERAYRLDTSERYSNGTQSSGGGPGGAIAGGLGGAGAGLSVASALGGRAGATPTGAPTQFSQPPQGYSLDNFRY